MKTVVVTGGNGFVGQYCLPKLIERGYTVHCVSTTRSGADSKGVIWHRVDLLKESCRDLFETIHPTHLLHLAWYTEHGKYWNSPVNFDWLQASMNLFNDFKAAGGKRFINVGTCAEYAWPAHCTEGVTEENPKTVYGRCKKSFTDFIASSATGSQPSTASARIFFLYGPGEPQNRLVPTVIKNLLAGSVPNCTDGLQLRDFMYVEDVARAISSLLDCWTTGVVNIASGEPVTIKNLIERIREEINSSVEVKFGALPRSPEDPDVITAACQRLKSEVGFLPKFTLKDGLQKTINAIKLESSHKL